MAGRPWTQEETQFIIDRNSAGIYHTDIAAEFGTKFGYSRSPDALRKRLVRMGVQIAPYQETPSEAAVALSRGKSQPRFKPTHSKLENFVRHDADIKGMFRRADLTAGQVFKLVVQSDTHVPYHDPAALAAFNKFLDWYKPHGLINIGDFWEAESVSHWAPNHPGARRLPPEILACRKELDETETAAGPQCKFKRFFIGNHCEWLDQYLTSQIPEIFDGLEGLGLNLSVKELLQLKKRGYKIIPFNECLRVGDAHFIHGMYTNQYHARKHLDVFGVNIIYGHTHDVQSHTNVNIRGVFQAQSIGCLRDLNARFMRGKPNAWTHAFAVLEFRPDGTYTMLVPIMIEHRFSFNGVLFDGNS